MKLLEELPDNREQLAFGLRRFAVLIATTLVLVVLMTPVAFEHFRAISYKQGDVAQYNIISPVDFRIENPVATERRRAEAQTSARRVFTFDDREAAGPKKEIEAFFGTIADLSTENKDVTQNHISDEERASIETQFRVKLSESDWALLEQVSLWPIVEEELRKLLEPIYQQGIIANKRTIQNALSSSSGAVMLRLSDGSEAEIVSDDSVVSLREAMAVFDADFPPDGFGRGATFDTLMRRLGHLFIKPNVIFDVEQTEKKIRDARSVVEADFEQVQRGEIIVRSGEVVNAQQQRKLEQMRELGKSRADTRTVIGYLIISSLIIITIYLFTASVWPKFRPTVRDLILMSSCLIGSFLLVKLHLVLGKAFSLSYAELDTTMLVLAAPLAAGGILLQVTLGSASVFYFTVVFALLIDIFFASSWLFMLMIIMGNIVGAVSVKRASRRSVFLLAGGRMALVNLIIVICFILLNPPASGETNALRMLCALIGGVMSGVFAAGLTPIAEFVGGYITDIKLLELASLDRPVLRDLAMAAPGTWNHSVVMGQMAESAAESIDANGLLARVGAYYHDIGKTRKPSYFTENQVGIDNRHDKLTPSMSALIIRAHVKDGVEMAKEAGLPQALIDFIPQHHGTALIEYFYEKAKKECEEGEVVDQSHYCYPGPKPQTKEAGILMLADNAEASSRSLPDPSPAKIQGLVQKMMNRVFASGQLDECELTLSDLHQIAKSFTRVLSAIYHRRVEYNEPAEKVREKAVEKSESGEVFVEEGAAESKVEQKADQKGPEQKGAEQKGSEQKKSAQRSGGEANGKNRAESTSNEKAPAAGTKDTLKRLGL
jgi:putative nucleotidyltransferase with HDIG domain